MQCPNCSFQNTPGLAACVRCRSTLDLTSVSITPPRASRSRTVRAARHAGQALRIGASDVAGSMSRSWTRRFTRQVRPGDLFWSIVPGLGQVHRGSRITGWTILVLWTTLLMLALSQIGSGTAYLLAFGALGVHCAAISLILTPAVQNLTLYTRMALGLATWTALLVAIYWPASVLAGRIARVVPISGITPSEMIRNDDVLLATGPWTRPVSFARGEIVAYEISESWGSGIRIAEGIGVDRIIGVPGDTVRIESGTLTVNGVRPAADLAPLRGVSHLPDMSITAGAHSYVVLPSLLAIQAYGNNPPVAAMIARAALLGESRIIGKAVCRVRPWSRFTRFPGG